MENNKKGIYYATLTWANYEDDRDYSITIARNTYEYLLEGIGDYRKKFKPRKAVLDTCSYESDDVVEDLTAKVKKELNYVQS